MNPDACCIRTQPTLRLLLRLFQEPMDRGQLSSTQLIYAKRGFSLLISTTSSSGGGLMELSLEVEAVSNLATRAAMKETAWSKKSALWAYNSAQTAGILLFYPFYRPLRRRSTRSGTHGGKAGNDEQGPGCSRTSTALLSSLNSGALQEA